MELQEFEVRVPQGHEKEGYVYMKHGQKYAVEAKNHSNKRCNAEIFVDGKSIGKWRINAKNSIKIERPADDRGCLTFYKKTSNEAKKLDVEIEEGKHGLVEVVFTPELIININWNDFKPLPGSNPSPWQPWQPWAKPSWYYQPTTTGISIPNSDSGGNIMRSNSVNLCSTGRVESLMCKSAAPRDAQAGLTGLSGKSHQEFSTASYMLEDQANAVTISMRLVGKRRRGSKKKKEGPRPLKKAYSTPIPPMPSK